MRSFAAIVSGIALFALPALGAPRPLIDIERAQGERKAGSYIVKLRETASKTSTLSSLASKLGNDKVTHNYDSTFFKGFAGTFSAATLDILRASADVEFIVEDGIATTQATQTGAPWGIARLSQNARHPAGSSPSSLSYTYRYGDQAGAGTDIYIVDTGIYTAHSDFGGRARWGATFGGYANADGNGHGTHCAGTAAGTRFGVAKAANLIAVKVLSDAGSGAYSDIINGLNWVVTSARSSGRPSIASLSLGGGANSALDSAVASVTAAGVHITVAAGNSNTDAGSTSPARAPSAITVGSSDINDARSSFSNYGSVVDIFAPGTSIPSTWIGSTTATNVISGTSMATPHVAGLVAYLISTGGNAAPATLVSRLHQYGLDGILTGIPSGTINELARNDIV